MLLWCTFEFNRVIKKPLIVYGFDCGETKKELIRYTIISNKITILKMFLSLFMYQKIQKAVKKCLYFILPNYKLDKTYRVTKHVWRLNL